MAFVKTNPYIREKTMRNFVRKLSLYFSAGALGGLTNSAAIWLAGMTGFTAYCQVKIAPAWTLPWLYPRIVWGGIWGLIFLLPIAKSRVFTRGVLLSLGPTLVQLFWVFPFKAHVGYLGFELGYLTPFLVFLFNAIWGITAALWIR
jgi:hypothetical protein